MTKTLYADGDTGDVCIFDGGAITTENWSDMRSSWYSSGGNYNVSALANTHEFVAYGSDLQVGAPAPIDVNNAQRIHVRYTSPNTGTVYNRYLRLPNASRGAGAMIKSLPLQPGDTFEGDPVVIQYGTDYQPFYDPLNNLGSLYFHSDLAYLNRTEQVGGQITLPERTRSSSTSKGFLGIGGGTYYNIQRGSSDYAVATHSAGTANVPFIVKYGSTQVPSGMVVHQVGQSVRAVFPYITSTHVRIYEQWITFDDTLPAVNRSFTFYLFNIVNPTATTGTSLKITGSRFRAGFDRLDTNNRYVRKVTSSADVNLTADKTADVANGSLKVVTPDGTTTFEDSSYNGTFTGGTSYGVKI